MATDPLRARALAVLRSGRCTIVRATDNEHHDVQRVMALVASSRPGRGRYVVDYAAHPFPGAIVGWQCTCRNGQHGEPCVHVAAVQLVTIGHIETASSGDSGVNADLPVKTGNDGDPFVHLAGSAPAPLLAQTATR